VARWLAPVLNVVAILLCGPSQAAHAQAPAQSPMLTSTRVELRVQLGHSSEITSVAVAPDGRTVLTGSMDRTARLWDVATGAEVRRFEGHTSGVQSAAFGPDGRTVLTGSSDGTVRLWAVATGTEIRRFEGHSSEIHAVAFSSDGRAVLTGSGDKTARLWNVATGTEIQRLEGHARAVRSVAVASDGRVVLTGSDDATARLWDAASGREIRRFTVHGGGYADYVSVRSVAFSPDASSVLIGSGETVQLWDVSSAREVRRFDGHWHFVTSVAFGSDGRRVVTGSGDGTARLWDVTTGQEIRRFEGDADWVLSVAFAPDGRTVLTGSRDRIARLWDTATGAEIRRFEGHTRAIRSVAVAPDGLAVLTGSDRTARLWDLTSGQPIRRFEGHTSPVGTVAFGSGGRTVLTGSSDGTTRIWDVTSGREIRRFEGREPVLSVAVAPDGRSVLTGSRERIARLRDVTSGQEIRRFEGDEGWVLSVAFAPDGRTVLTGSNDGTARLWDATTGAEIRRFKGHTSSVESVAFTPDGRAVFTGGWDGTARLWSVASGAEIRRFEDHTFIESVAVAPDGRTVLTGSTDGTARLWAVATGAEIRRFKPASWVWSVAFTPDGSKVVTGTQEGTTRIWKTETGALLASLVSFGDGGWAVVDSEGRYDASDPDHSPALHWLLGDEVIELRQLKERFYAPGLLARILGFNPEPLAPVAGLQALRPAPTVEVTPPEPGQSVARVRLANRGGGFGRVVVKVNGRAIEGTAREPPPDAATRAAELTLDLGAATLEGDGRNTIEVIPYPDDNQYAGRGVVISWEQKPTQPSVPRALHAILAGVSTFEHPSLNLTYAAKDALDMTRALEIAGRSPGGRTLFPGGVHLATFTTGTPRAPTKEHLRAAFQAVATRAGPDDVLVVYFAGHGVAGKRERDTYYFLTRDARSIDPDADPALREASTVSSAELREWLTRPGMPLRQVVVLDTCAAGAAATELLKLADRRDLTPDQRRAAELLKDATGSHILMGAAADKVSYEATRYGQGLLTYALLDGMRGKDLDEGGRLDVRRWFDSARQRVKEDLARGIGGIQEPVVRSPRGDTFPIAVLTMNDIREIPLSLVKPQLLRAQCLDDDDADRLTLCAVLRAELRAASIPAPRGQRGGEPPLVYLDQVAGEVADAYTPQVRYWLEGDGVRLRLRLSPAEAPPEEPKRLETTITVPSRDSKEVARQVAAALIKLLPAPGR
jgi:WD40 repeat protein